MNIQKSGRTDHEVIDWMRGTGVGSCIVTLTDIFKMSRRSLTIVTRKRRIRAIGLLTVGRLVRFLKSWAAQENI